MKFLDLKKYSSKYFNFIYNDKDFLIYTTLREREKKSYFTICIYYIDNKVEKLVKEFQIDRSKYYDYRVFLQDDTIFIINKENKFLNILTITDYKKNKNEDNIILELEGELRHVNILDKTNLVVFIERPGFLPKEYSKYRSNISFNYKFAYLIDLEEVRSYFIKDIKLVLGGRDYLYKTSFKKKEVIFFEEAYREDWENEFYYFKGVFDKNDKIKKVSSLNFLEFKSFIENIKSGEEHLKFYVIDQIDKEGIVKYLGEDLEKIYYRKKFFETGIERIYSLNKKQGYITEEDIIEHNKYIGDFYYNTSKRNIFYEEEIGENKWLLGVFNRDCNIFYDKRIGTVEDFIEDRYLITYYSEEYDGIISEYAVIRDIIEKKEVQYEGLIRVFNNYVILY